MNVREFNSQIRGKIFKLLGGNEPLPDFWGSFQNHDCIFLAAMNLKHICKCEFLGLGVDAGIDT